MTKTKTDRRSTPVDTVDSEVIAFRQQFDERSPLDQILQEGARKMLQEAIDAEVDTFIDQHRDRRDERGRRLVVKNGNLPAREILTGAGAIEVEQGRVRDNSPNPDDRVRFTPSVLPAYLRRTVAIEELIPWLYLKGVSTNDFGESQQPDSAFQLLLGDGTSLNFLVEVDCGTEPIRSNKQRESLEGKIRFYDSYQDRTEKRFRVLMLFAKSSARLNHFCQAVSDLVANSHRTLFLRRAIVIFRRQRKLAHCRSVS